VRYQLVSLRANLVVVLDNGFLRAKQSLQVISIPAILVGDEVERI